MRFPIPLFLLATSFLAASSALAAEPASLDREYQQVRAIALRDRKVQAAYEEADRKLQSKIVQIDPALADYSPGKARRAANPKRDGARSQPERASTPTPKPASAKMPLGSERKHTVRQGETLGGIATIYGVTVPGLKKINGIQDERKLRVGQLLAVPPRVR